MLFLDNSQYLFILQIWNNEHVARTLVFWYARIFLIHANPRKSLPQGRLHKNKECEDCE